MNCADVDAIMTAYVDGEAAPAEAEAVREHLDGCPDCRARAAAEQDVRARLQAAAPTLGERAPAALWARCAAVAHGGPAVAAPPSWPAAVRWAPLSLAATVLLAVGALFVAGQNPGVGALVAQLAIDHDKCFMADPAARPAFGRQEARVQLAGIVGSDVALPVESSDFDLLDVRECSYERGGIGHVLCHWRGYPVSLFVVPGGAQGEQLLEIINHDAVVWTAGGHTHVLVAERGPVDIEQVARHIRQAVD